MRKGHLSYKVPNVKLRPAPASQASQQRVVAPKTKYLKRKIRVEEEDEQVVEEETQAAELDEFDAIAQSSRESKPLEGKIVCLTGLRDQRVSLAPFFALCVLMTDVAIDRPNSKTWLDH